jgi:hypothetical protein
VQLFIVRDDKYFNPEKEIKRLTLKQIIQSTITKNKEVFYPINMELYRLTRSKKK